jgi:hypothetical protein
MKLYFSSLIICLIGLSTFQIAAGQNAAKARAKTSVPKFTGKWKGSEKCTLASAPVALLLVTANGSDVLLTGLYSVQGQIKAIIIGDTLIISRQEVRDPNFMNLFVEGKLVLGTNPFSLTGDIVVMNNQQKDVCSVKYYK